MTDVDSATDLTNAERGYTITRLMHAPRELVWRCWTDPEQYAVWFGGHDGRMEDLQMDVRPGGQWSATMVLPDGATIGWKGHYLEVDEPTRLVVAFTDQDILGAAYETFTVSLTDLDGSRTEMVVRQHGGHLTDEQYVQGKRGTGIFLDVMAELLASKA